MRAFNEEFRAAGLPTFDDVRGTIQDIVQDVSSLQGEDALKSGLVLGVKKMIEESSEPSLRELKDSLVAIRGKLRRELSRSFENVKKQLPRKPGPGRGKMLNLEKESAACDSVAELIRKKVPYPVILKRVGQKFGVSDRTIQRAWQRREKEH